LYCKFFTPGVKDVPSANVADKQGFYYPVLKLDKNKQNTPDSLILTLETVVPCTANFSMTFVFSFSSLNFAWKPFSNYYPVLKLDKNKQNTPDAFEKGFQAKFNEENEKTTLSSKLSPSLILTLETVVPCTANFSMTFVFSFSSLRMFLLLM
jgi:hypothetical protein